MSAYAIAARENAPEVARLLQEKGLADAPLVVVEKGHGPAALEEAARVPADVLILDVNAGPGLGKAVLRYRLARPQTRVILLALGRQPGDPETAQVVQAGVYDVVTQAEDLPAALDGPPADFAQAALWLDPTLAPEAEQRPREVVVEKRVPISTRPVLLAVLNAAPGAGATTAAASAAGFLAHQGYRTCLVAADGTRDLELVSGIEPEKEPRRWVPGLDLWSGDFRDVLVLGRYEYVVADLGRPAYQEAAALPADVVLVVLPPPHRIDRVLAWLETAAYRGQPIPRARYVALGRVRDPEGLGKVWAAAFGPTKPDPPPLPVFGLPVPEGHAWPPGYRNPDPGLDAALAQLLAPVLPEAPRRGLPIRAAAGKLAWPAVLALAGLAIWLARAEIAAALRRLFAF